MLGGDYSALDIGITASASYLNQRTVHKAKICDLTFNRGNWKDFLGEHIKENRPDIAAVSATTLYMSYVRQVVKELKQRYHLIGYRRVITPPFIRKKS